MKPPSLPLYYSASVLLGKRSGDKLKENDDPSTGIGLFIGGVITGVLATLLGGVLVWVLVRKCVTMRVRSVNSQSVEFNMGHVVTVHELMTIN